MATWIKWLERPTDILEGREVDICWGTQRFIFGVVRHRNLGIMNDVLRPRNSKIYGKEPRYSETSL